MVFSTLHLEKLGNIREHYWKQRLKISRSAKFQSDLLKTNEDIAPDTVSYLAILLILRLSFQ